MIVGIFNNQVAPSVGTGATVGATLGGPAGALIGAGVGAVANMWMARQQRKHAEKFYHLDREFNLPINQMKRLEEAGINPHMAYMKGTLNNTTSGTLPKYQRPRAVEPMLVQSALAQSQINLQQSQADLNKTQTGLVGAQTEVQKGLARLQAVNADIAESTKKAMIEFANLKPENLNAQTALATAQKLLADKRAWKYRASIELIETFFNAVGAWLPTVIQDQMESKLQRVLGRND